MKGLKFRFSRKLVFLMMGSIVVLGGGSGAAAVLIGTNNILGPSYLQINGLECTVLETIKMKRDRHYWVRKYVTSDEAGDGMARIRTALRVARAVQAKEKADLVQVAMIDKAGPKERAQMRGRMIGAQVVYIPDPETAPEGTDAQAYSAYYLDGPANSNGEYYGMRIDLPLEDVEALTASLTDDTGCIDPAAPEGGHGAPAGAHGEKTGGHGESGSHDEVPVAEHGAPAEEHGAPANEHAGAAVVEDHGDQANPDEQPAGHGRDAAAKQKEEQGFFASVKDMLFGSGDKGEPEPTDEASAEPSAPAPEPRTAAEGGRRWSKSTDADEKHSGDTAETVHVEDAPSATDGTTAADAAGAAWLAKMRGETVQHGEPAEANEAASGKPEMH